MYIATVQYVSTNKELKALRTREDFSHKTEKVSNFCNCCNSEPHSLKSTKAKVFLNNSLIFRGTPKLNDILYFPYLVLRLFFHRLTRKQ